MLSLSPIPGRKRVLARGLLASALFFGGAAFVHGPASLLGIGGGLPRPVPGIAKPEVVLVPGVVDEGVRACLQQPSIACMLASEGRIGLASGHPGAELLLAMVRAGYDPTPADIASVQEQDPGILARISGVKLAQRVRQGAKPTVYLADASFIRTADNSLLYETALKELVGWREFTPSWRDYRVNLAERHLRPPTVNREGLAALVTAWRPFIRILPPQKRREALGTLSQILFLAGDRTGGQDAMWEEIALPVLSSLEQEDSEGRERNRNAWSHAAVRLESDTMATEGAPRAMRNLQVGDPDGAVRIYRAMSLNNPRLLLGAAEAMRLRGDPVETVSALAESAFD